VVETLFFLLLALASPAPTEVERPRSDVAATRGVAYGKARGYSGGRTTLRMDVYRPAASGGRRLPVLVWMHGGGFIAGSRESMASYARAFASRGYVAATISYRLGTHAQRRRLGYRKLATGAKHDAQAALRFLRRRSARFGADRRRVFVGGYSAGGIAALQLAFRGSRASRVRGAVAIAGAADPLGIDRGDAPVLWFHGNADRTVPYVAAQLACGAARRGGAGCRLVTFPGSGHEIAGTRFERIVSTTARWLAER